MGISDPDAVRAEMLERWGRAAAGWGKRAKSVRAFGLPVSAWMLDHAGLQPGLRVLELAAGPGETGFLAAELIRPGGSLVCSDATDEMLEVARARAEELGIENVEFKRIELEWIDLDTASVDAVLCKWGLMFAVDPEAAYARCAACCGRVVESHSRYGTSLRGTRGPRSRRARSWSSGTPSSPIPTRQGCSRWRRPGACKACSRPPGSWTWSSSRSSRRARLTASRSTSPRPTICRACSATCSIRSRMSSAPNVMAKITELAQPYIGADGALRFPARSLVAAADA